MTYLEADGRLNGQGIHRLSELLASALLSPPRALQFLLTRLDLNWYDYDTQSGFRSTLFTLVQQLNAEYRWQDLLREARNAYPADPGLVEFAAAVALAPVASTTAAGGQSSEALDGPGLELKIKAAQSTYNIAVWRSRLGEIEGRVCRIEFPPGSPQGTGFLIGESLVMTNYHVIEAVKSGAVEAKNVALRFDYKVQPGGVAVAEGQAYSLAADWLAAWSPYSPHDVEREPTGLPQADQLDFAILRVDGSPGTDPVGGPTDDPAAVERGWLRASPQYGFEKKSGLYIVQHPDGLPMQVAIDSDAVLDVNGNGTRVRYTTTTQPGSSGSPIFSPDWSWVALHHSGDPNYDRFYRPGKYNQGIPVSAITSHLRARSLEQLIEVG